jgi:hypothetical protein
MTRGFLGAALIAASIAAAPAGAATYSYIVGFGANYSGGVPGFRGSLSGGFGINDSRSVTQDVRGVPTEVRGSTRAGIVGGQPSLGFSLGSGPADGSFGEAFYAGASVGFFDGLLLAAPVRPNTLPTSLQFNLVTRVSGSYDVNDEFGGGVIGGNLGTSFAMSQDALLFETALRDAQRSRNLAIVNTGIPGSFSTRRTFSLIPANTDDLLINVFSGATMTFAERDRLRRQELARQRAECAAIRARENDPGRVCFHIAPDITWQELQVATIGLGVAFGGAFVAEGLATSEILASNSLIVEGLYVTDGDTGDVIPMWIGGLSGVDYTLATYRPEGENPFAALPDGGPAVIPLPAAGWLLLGALAGLAGLGRRRTRA